MTGSLSMVLIDETVVSVALPTIQRDLDMSQSELQWVVNAYLLALAAFVAVGGRLGEIFGQGRVFKIGAVVFLVASTACGFADSETLVITARAVQGLGAALMIPASGAIVINAFDVKERGRAMGIYAGISMISLALGPLLGGVLTQGWTWRAVFWINIPVGLVMLAMAAVSLPRDRRDREAHIDWPGAFTLVPGLVAVVLALMQAQDWGWTSAATISLLVGGAVLILAFVLVERRARWPLVAPGLFRSRNFTVDNVVLGLVQFALTGITVFGAIYVQDLLGFGPIGAGLSLLPITIPLLLLAPRAGRIYDRVGPRVLVAAGAGLIGASFICIALLLDQLDYAWLVAPYAVAGVGLALVMTPASTDAMNAAPAALRGEASGVMQTMRQVGGTIGLAVMGTVVATVQSNHLADFVAGTGGSPADQELLERALSETQGDPAALQGAPPGSAAAAQDALVSGIQSAYYVGGAAVLAGALLAALLLRRERAADEPGLSVPATPGAHPAVHGAGVAAEQADS